MKLREKISDLICKVEIIELSIDEATDQILALILPQWIPVRTLREQYGYAGKPKQWQIGFDAALKELLGEKYDG